ncbi:sugar kinase [Amycolatopsis magusensis]|uniref:sugar kinase n=1 Tax=Amycolatopsis magusensis TaxID=882444 RepID=UPI0024A9054A|nr:sugar kinase [Amycolatopsis magusensis]MDI5979237.1 sugar kinase [Amycolatopsis magusensis]
MIVTLGETMALLTPRDRLLAGTDLRLGIGGAESNVAIGLARLGVDATWISRVGDDDLGTAVIREIRAEGVRVLAERDPHAPTGLMIKEMRHGRPSRVRYHRAGSAASQLTPAFVDTVATEIEAAQVLHLTGITPALGPEPRAAVARAVEIAHTAGTAVSFDVNHRRTLWPDAQARDVLTELLRSVDLLFAGPEEAALLGAHGDPGTTIRKLADLGPATVVLKLGERGALGLAGDHLVHAPTDAVDVVDAVGAGDAFVAGYLAAQVDGADLAGRLALGNQLGGTVCRMPGDWEGLPTRADLDLAPAADVVR